MGLSSCDKRRDIYDDAPTWVVVNIDWSKANITPNGTSVWFFPEDGSSAKVLKTNHTCDSIKLYSGNYKVVVFNETIDDFGSIDFTGTDSYNNFEAECAATKAVYNSDSGNSFSITSSPGILAAQTTELNIPLASAVAGERFVMNFTPERKVAKLYVDVNIKNINYLSTSAYSQGFLQGVSKGYYFVADDEATETTAHQFSLNKVQYDVNTYPDGTVSGSVDCFGLLKAMTARSAEDIKIDMKLLLRNNTWYEVSRRINNLIVTEDEGQLTFRVDLGTGADGDDFITLPYVEDSDGNSGFNANVDDWGDEIHIIL